MSFVLMSCVSICQRTSGNNVHGKTIPQRFPKVENIGFEPMTSCMPCKRSSQLS